VADAPNSSPPFDLYMKQLLAVDLRPVFEQWKEKTDLISNSYPATPVKAKASIDTSPIQAKRLGRPPLDREVLLNSLNELERKGAILIFRGWRTEVAMRIQDAYAKAFPDQKPPTIKSIRDKMKSDFDDVEARLKVKR
jgi:hypothetical protein